MEIIKIEGLNFTYPDGTKAIQDINLMVSAGESLGILGANGAGKTTLLFHLNGILRGKGEIEICGLTLNKKNLIEIRRRVGLVFQNPEEQLFSSTVFEDVAFAPLNLDLTKEEIEKRVRESLALVGMAGYEQKMPQHLSLGEKKKIALATVLAQKPEILVIDEPSGNLDPKIRRQLINLLKNFNHTKIIASHDLNLISALCTRVILLDKGRIVAEGKTSEILTNQQILTRYF